MKNKMIEGLKNKGFLVIPKLFLPVDCKRVLKELAIMNFCRAHTRAGHRGVEQRFEKLELKIDEIKKTFIAQKILISQSVLSNELSADLNFNDIRAHKYVPGGIGIGPHHDGNKFINAIAIILLKGESDFFVYDDGVGSNPQHIDAKEGDCILLRAPGIGGSHSGPYHGVGEVSTERITLTLRQLRQ